MLYLFDLDNTLVRTDDLSGIREAGLGDASEAYASSVKSALGNVSERLIWSPDQLTRLLEKAPLSKDAKNHLGVFTRAPRSYARAVLQASYPSILWDVVIAYEHVDPKFKPHGLGIAAAREFLKTTGVLVIGDNAVDLKAAYHAVCWTAWDETKQNGKFDFQAYDLLPDFIYGDVEEFLAAMDDPISHQMALEVYKENREAAMPRVVGNGRTIVLFCPEGRTHKIRVFGRHFSKYPPLKAMRACHGLSKEIEACKSAETFPDIWVAVLIHACRDQLKFLGRGRPQARIILTCIPPRPAREHRLGKLISQTEGVYRSRFGSDRVIFDPHLYIFRPGVRSNSKDYLSREERFENIASHMEVSPDADLGEQDTVIVVDDVVTSGSTLIGAERLLLERGVNIIQLLALAKNIGNFMPEKWAKEALYAPNE